MLIDKNDLKDGLDKLIDRFDFLEAALNVLAEANGGKLEIKIDLNNQYHTSFKINSTDVNTVTMVVECLKE